MGVWLKELKDNCAEDIIVQVVGTKADVVTADPEKREVPFDRCIGYVAEHMNADSSTADSRLAGIWGSPSSNGSSLPQLASPNSNRSSGFWGQDSVWDCAHEVSAKDGEGIEEVFRIITRKLVEQHGRKTEHLKTLENLQAGGRTSEGYFDLPNQGTGSFRVGYGDKRRSWLGPLTPGGLSSYREDSEADVEVSKGLKRGRCC